MLFVLQLAGYRVGDVANSKLNGRAILNQGSYIFTDLLIDRGVGSQLDQGDRVSGFHNGIHFRNMHLRITKGPGEVGVHFQQYQRAFVDQIPFIDRADGERKITVFIHRGGGCHNHRPSALVPDAGERFA